MLNIWYANDLPYGPRPIWARAHMGPGPLGPGPFLVGRTPHQKTHPGKKSPNCVFCVFFGNKKDARRPYDHFGGGIAPRSLLCVRKRRFLFLGKILILDLSDGRNNLREFVVTTVILTPGACGREGLGGT